MVPFQTILHATDFSERAESAFRLACALASDCHAHLVLVHVMRRPRFMLAPEGQQQEMLEKLWSLHVPGGVSPPGRRLEEGQPAEEILRLAKIVHADLIVIGTNSRHGLKRLLGHSVAEQVVREADCPVLTVREPSKLILSTDHFNLDCTQDNRTG